MHTIRTEPPPAPTYYRLSEESWAEIAAAYANGATAMELSAKWRVSPGSIYRHVRRLGLSKRAHADSLARAHARALTEREVARVTEDLFAGGPREGEDAGALSQLARAASARAMRAARWGEALTLAKLAETYARLDVRGTESELERCLKVLTEPDYASALFARNRGEPRDDPNDHLKRAYWEWRATQRRYLEDWIDRAKKAERQLEALANPTKT